MTTETKPHALGVFTPEKSAGETPMTELLNRPHSSIETYVNNSPDPLKAIEAFGKWISKSGMMGCQKEEQGMIIAIACIEMGIGLIEFAQTYDIMHNGKLRKKALAAHVEFVNLGGVVKWIDAGESREKAEVELSYGGQVRKFTFSLEDAKRANLVKKDGAWETWTADMLCARVLSRGIARMCPKVYAGFEADEDSVPALLLPKSEPAAIAPAPVQTPAPPPAPAAPVTPEAPKPVETPGLLTVEEAEQLAAKLGPDNIVRAVAWMQRQQPAWLTAEQVASGEPFRFLTPKRVNKIMTQTEQFLRAINNPAQTA